MHDVSCLSSYQMQELSAEERRTCREALKSLLGKVYQPIVIKQLLILQGGPRQVRRGVAGTAGARRVIVLILEVRL